MTGTKRKIPDNGPRLSKKQKREIRDAKAAVTTAKKKALKQAAKKSANMEAERIRERSGKFGGKRAAEAKKKMKPELMQNYQRPPQAESTLEHNGGSDDLVESDTSEDENGFYGFSAKNGDSESIHSGDDSGFSADEEEGGGVQLDTKMGDIASHAEMNGAVNGADTSRTSSKEAHAKQKAQVQERRAAKPNADIIQRSKKLWERLRMKSHVPLEERKKLVNELFEIVTGCVKDLVFKHDAVRVIQCAIKYANPEQRKMIARELKGNYKALAEGKYAKHLIGKLMVEGDDEIRDMIISEFYGHARYLINHPEASWIFDDIYRVKATREQKARILKEWYGPEFAIFKSMKEKPSADLSEILTASPEKRKPIMSYLQGLINQLIQKKLTGFTMLHDACLQYFLNTLPGSEEHNEFLQLLRDDEECDLLKNLAFTKSGSRIVCLALAYGNAKERRNMLQVYKELIETLAYDAYGHLLLLTAYDVVDDTVGSSKAIFGNLIPKGSNDEVQNQKIVELANHTTARRVLLYPFSGRARWLVDPQDQYTQVILAEIQEIRKTTSKKSVETRQTELTRALSEPLLKCITTQAQALSETTYGCQLVTETLFSAPENTPARKAAIAAVADLAKGNPKEETHISHSVTGGRMLRTLVLGGRWDQATKKVIPVQPPLGFADTLYEKTKDHLVDWACGGSSFLVVNMLETEGFEGKKKVEKVLKKGITRLEKAATEETEEQKAAKTEKDVAEKDLKRKKGKKGKKDAEKRIGNAGSRLLLEKLG